MIDPKTITEQLLFSTARLEVDLADGGKSVGTGFFYNHKVNSEKLIPLIITNKHVVDSGTAVTFYLHEAVERDNKKSLSDVSFKLNVANDWIMHEDGNIDLCAMPIGMLLTAAKKVFNKDLYYISIDDSFIYDDTKLQDLSAVEDILMIGYPNGLWDAKNNLPLVRKGITSSHPAVDFERENIGVIDAACFPGSSGSPILIVNEGSFQDKLGNINIGASRIVFLGVLFEGPTISSDGEIKVEQIPTVSKITSKHHLMMNLGYYIKAKEVKALGNQVQKNLEVKR